MKMLSRVLAELEKGPASSQDIADELEISLKAASAHLSEIHNSLGYTKRKEIESPWRHGRRLFEYELKEYGRFLEDEHQTKSTA